MNKKTDQIVTGKGMHMVISIKDPFAKDLIMEKIFNIKCLYTRQPEEIIDMSGKSNIHIT